MSAAIYTWRAAAPILLDQNAHAELGTHPI